MASGVDVVPSGELLDPLAHVAPEQLDVVCLLGRCVDAEPAEVVVERELDVHVDDVTAGQVEGVVRPAAGSERRLLLVVDPFDEARRAQDVFGHPLAPLTARLGRGEGTLEMAGGLGERGGRLEGLLETSRELARLAGAVLLEVADEGRHPLELELHAFDLAGDDIALRAERDPTGFQVIAELGAGDGEHVVERGLEHLAPLVADGVEGEIDRLGQLVAPPCVAFDRAGAPDRPADGEAPERGDEHEQCDEEQHGCDPKSHL